MRSLRFPTEAEFVWLDSLEADLETGEITNPNGKPIQGYKVNSGTYLISGPLLPDKPGQQRKFTRSHIVWYKGTGRWPDYSIVHRDKQAQYIDALSNLYYKV